VDVARCSSCAPDATGDRGKGYGRFTSLGAKALSRRDKEISLWIQKPTESPDTGEKKARESSAARVTRIAAWRLL
jgi:hypothetical protein